MDNFERLRNNVSLTSVRLKQYLETGDIYYYISAKHHHSKVYERSTMFNTYYYYSSAHGYSLSTYFSEVFYPPYLYSGQENNIEFLSRYQVSLEKLQNALQIDDEEWVWQTHPIPRHPISKKFTTRVLDVLKEITLELKEAPFELNEEVN